MQNNYIMTKEQYIESILRMMQETTDDIMLDFIYKLLLKTR